MRKSIYGRTRLKPTFEYGRKPNTHRTAMTLTLTSFVRSFFLLSFLLISAAVIKADAVDNLVRSRMQERNIPGAAIAVIKNGKVLKVKGYGVASLEFGVPAVTETVFEIGSVSKQMTAAGIMLLAEDGKVDLDEKISKYLPKTPDSWNEVTVRHLLTHTSGIKNYTSLTGFELSRRLTIERFIKQLAEHPLEFTPGEKNTYSNSGYNLLAYIIETQSGRPFAEFMRERIFLPLEMKKTGDRDPKYIIPQRAAGYEWRIDRYEGRDGNLTDLMGAGSITSTIADMIKWETALRGDRFLKPESKREMWTQFKFANGQKSVYGLGWRISDIRGHKLIGHTGQTAGFGAAIFRYVEDDLTVIALTNLGELGMGNFIASSVAKLYLPKLSLRNFKAISDPDKDRSERFLTALRKRLANETEQPELSAELLRNVTTERAKALHKRLISYGSIVEFRHVGEETIDSKTVYRFVALTPLRATLWRFGIAPDGKISEMTLEEEE